MAEPAASAPSAPPDDLDPELISLKRKRSGIGPVLAVSVLLLCVVTLFRLRHDLAFAAGGATPSAFGDAAAAYAAGKAVPDNAFVELTARPDRASPGWLRGKQAVGHRLVPALGTSGRLWLRMLDETRVAPIYDEVYRGRTRRLADLPFHAELADYVRALPPRPHWLDPAALGAGAPERDVSGDRVSIDAATPVELDQRVAGAALVTVYANDTIKDEPAARAALVAAGLAPAPALVSQTDRSWVFEVAAPEGPAAVRATISKASLWAAMAADSVSDKVIRHAGVYGDIAISAGQVTLKSGASFPLADVSAVVVHLPPVLPADAEILLVGEKPGDYWYLYPVFGALGLVALLMLWALVHALRHKDQPHALPFTIQPPAAPGAS